MHRASEADSLFPKVSRFQQDRRVVCLDIRLPAFTDDDPWEAGFAESSDLQLAGPAHNVLALGQVFDVVEPEHQTCQRLRPRLVQDWLIGSLLTHCH